MANIGCVIAQRITASLVGNGISYEKLSKIIYSEFLDISNEMKLGDRLEFPDGTTFELTYKPKRGGNIITRKDWHESKKSWTEFAMPEDEIDQETFDHFLECLPPDEWTANGFMVSEMNDFNEFGRGLYMTFVNFKGKYFYAGLLTKMEFRNNQLKIIQTTLEHKRMEEL